MPSESSVTGYFQVVETQKVPGMQYRSSIFGNLLKPIDRRQFLEIVERHDADASDHISIKLERYREAVGVVPLHNFQELPSIDWFERFPKMLLRYCMPGTF